MNVVESISGIVIPDESSDLHSVFGLQKMRMEFFSISKCKNKVVDDQKNMIVDLQHKLVEEVSEERDELKYNHCLIDEPQQHAYNKNNTNLSPPPPPPPQLSKDMYVLRNRKSSIN